MCIRDSDPRGDERALPRRERPLGHGGQIGPCVAVLGVRRGDRIRVHQLHRDRDLTRCVRHGSRGALGADRAVLAVAGQLAAVVDEEAARAGELVGLARHDPHGHLLAGEVGARQLEALRQLGLVDVDIGGGRVTATGLELLDGVL